MDRRKLPTPDADLAVAQLVSAKQLAGLLQLSTRSVWRRLAQAEIGEDDFPRAIRLSPRVVRFRLADVLAFVERCRKEG